MTARFGAMLLAAAWALGGCGSRPPYWDGAPSSASSFGLKNGVAIVDDSDHRVLFLTALADQELSTRALPVGHHVASAVTSPDGTRLFVLSTGDSPRRTSSDQSPSLTVIDVDASTFEPRATPYAMSEPLANLAIDPLDDWAVAYAGARSTAFVQNPNELVLFDLAHPASQPLSLTLQTFGGTPQRLTFTPPVMLPGGARRLLVVETDIDVTLLDLDGGAVQASQVTLRLTSGASALQVSPAGVVVDPGGARIALRAVGVSNVYSFKLGSMAPGSSGELSPAINLTDVGGVPSDIAFVQTNAGLRVAALVPSTSSAVLVDPDMSLTTRVALPAAYSNLSLVTSIVGGGTGPDVAMLWNASGSGPSNVALWTLSQSVMQPYFSIEVLGVTQPIHTVDDVNEPNQRLKVLETSNASGFVVLDLQSRMAAPLLTPSSASLSIAPDGLRMWAFARGGTDLDAIEFANLSPVSLTTDPPIDAVYDVARPPGVEGRSLIAVHNRGTIGATVFDALHPDTATARRVPALLLEGP